MIKNKNISTGGLLCFIIALISWSIANTLSVFEIVGAPVLAIIFGMVITRFIKNKIPFQEGIVFCSKKLLQYAIILLGFGLNLSTVAKVGGSSLPVILSTISTSLIVSFIICKLLNIPKKTAILIGVGSSICGGSAIAATAPVIEADDKEVAQAISVIFLFNVIAAVVFPILGSKIGLSNTGFGLFAGTAINDTSSVSAAASTWDTIHNTGGSVLSYATIVKLTRTLAIIPITLVLSLYQARNQPKRKDIKIKDLFPRFILYFLLASLITTFISLYTNETILVYSNQLFNAFKTLSKFFIVMAMSAIGFNTDIVELIKKGGKPMIQGFTCWVSISIISLSLQYLLGIW